MRNATPHTSEAELAKLALDRAAADLASDFEPFETEDDGREPTGQPSIGQGTASQVFEDALEQIAREATTSEHYRLLRDSLAHAERRLERRRERVKHAGDEVRPIALANLEAEENAVFALQRRLTELEDSRQPGVHTCPRCDLELRDSLATSQHRFDCRRTRRDT